MIDRKGTSPIEDLEKMFEKNIKETRILIISISILELLFLQVIIDHYILGMTYNFSLVLTIIAYVFMIVCIRYFLTFLR